MLIRHAALAFGACLLLAPRADAKTGLALARGETEPAGARGSLDATALAALKDAVAKDPKDRTARFNLVRGLQRAGQPREALEAARAWRTVDAYNLVVVRLIGDLYSELGQKREARRAYSAVVELLPKDASAQRALASVLKQAGDLDGAYGRLIVAAADAPKDQRLAFELADVAARLGKSDEARTRFEAVVADPEVPEAVRYPAKQRLAQIYQALGRATDADALGIKGGTQNDIKVYLTWDTDHSDVDLWVTNPSGEKVFYGHKEGKFGEALFDDVTTGYGPESFTAKHAHDGDYLVQVNYFGRGRSNFSEARGEVVVVLGEGRPDEQKFVLPYKLFDEKQTVSVARIHVGDSK